MQQKLNIVVCLVSFTILSLVFSDAGRVSLVGEWEPMKDIKDPHLTKIAKFAVSEYNKRLSHSSLKLIRVMKGEMKVVQGVMYKLDLTTTGTNGFVAGEYRAIVWETDSKRLELISFLPSKAEWKGNPLGFGKCIFFFFFFMF